MHISILRGGLLVGQGACSFSQGAEQTAEHVALVIAKYVAEVRQAVSQEAWLGGSSSARCCAVSGPPLLCSSAAISSSIALRPRS